MENGDRKGSPINSQLFHLSPKYPKEFLNLNVNSPIPQHLMDSLLLRLCSEYLNIIVKSVIPRSSFTFGIFLS